jgi:hypothetical protein
MDDGEQEEHDGATAMEEPERDEDDDGEECSMSDEPTRGFAATLRRYPSSVPGSTRKGTPTGGRGRQLSSTHTSPGEASTLTAYTGEFGPPSNTKL